MTQRVARMKGALDGLKHNQTLTFSAIALVSTVLVALNSYILVKVDGLGGRIDGLVGRIDGLGVRVDGLIGRVDARIDILDGRMTTLEMRVNELPGKIAAELRDLNNTLAQAITAAKQAPPQVIVIPTPAPANGPGQPPRTP
jgi:hypothetical protein